MGWGRKAIIAAVAVMITSVFFINFCNLVYKCGCTYLWAGADLHCNIHTGPRHCPWCAIGATGQRIIWLSMVIPQLWISFGSKLAFFPRLAAAIAAFPAAGAVAALVTGVWRGYWD